MSEINKKEVGLRIKAIRQERGMTQEEFGKLLNATKGNVSLWENGIVLPNTERLKYIADLSSISVNELLYGTQDKTMYIGNGDKPIKAWVYGYTHPKSWNNNIRAEYMISLFVEVDSNIKTLNEGSFTLKIDMFSDITETKTFNFNCRYSFPEDTRTHVIFIKLNQILYENADLSDSYTYYENYAMRIGSDFYEALTSSIKSIIFDYVNYVSQKPLTVDIQL